MKTWKEAKADYIKSHLTKSLKDPQRRLNALAVIEKKFKEGFPELLNDKDVFSNIRKMYLLKLYECLKGSSVSSAEQSVINGLYKFSN